MTTSLSCFAITAPGLEPIAAGELRRLGVDPTVVAGGVEWAGDQASLLSANLHLRTASRVVVRVARFRARSFIELERHLGRVDWRPYLPEGRVIQLRVSSTRSKLYHERAIAERFERILADRVGATPRSRTPSATLAAEPAGDSDATSAAASIPPSRGGSGRIRSASADAADRIGPAADAPQPSTPAGDPLRSAYDEGDESALGRPSLRPSAEDDDEPGSDAQLIIVRFLRDECTISVDASGDLLHRRGYRLAVAKAPLRETIAAAMLLAVGWDPRAPLLDPFCGSGTIPIEAGLIAANVPPGLAAADRRPRRFVFTDWPGFDAEIWERIVRDARSRVREVDAVIRASDRDEGAVRAARDNAARAGLAGLELEVAALTRATPPPGRGWLVTNPPYGVRIGERKRLRDLYAAFGNWARSRLAGWSVAMLAPDLALPRHTGLSWEERLRTVNGGVPVRLLTTRVSPAAAPPPAAP